MDGAHPRAWVMTIARRKAIDFHRARARRPEPRERLPEGGAADRRLEAADGATDELWAAVGALPPAQREAVALRYGADLSYREIGAALDCSEAAARRRVADALKSLREGIDREEAKR
jgi:RNA polymerase sigma factor (sigma-70 family)